MIATHNVISCNLIKKETAKQTSKYLKLFQPKEIIIGNHDAKWRLKFTTFAFFTENRAV